MENVAVFIDGGYMDKLLYDSGGLRIDFGEFVRRLVEGRHLLRAYYYHCLPYRSAEPTQQEEHFFRNKEKFFNALRRIDQFEVRLGHLAFRGIDSHGQRMLEQKGVDVQLAVDLLTLAFNRVINTAVLLAGDGDLVPAVVKAKDLGVKVQLFYGDGPNTRVSEMLWYACDQRTLVERSLLEGCRLPGHGHEHGEEDE